MQVVVYIHGKEVLVIIGKLLIWVQDASTFASILVIQLLVHYLLDLLEPADLPYQMFELEISYEQTSTHIV